MHLLLNYKFIYCNIANHSNCEVICFVSIFSFLIQHCKLLHMATLLNLYSRIRYVYFNSRPLIILNFAISKFQIIYCKALSGQVTALPTDIYTNIVHTVFTNDLFYC